VLHSTIKRISAITITLALALSIASCTAKYDSGFAPESENSTSILDQNSRILTQTAGNNPIQNTSDASNQTEQTVVPVTVIAEAEYMSGEFGAAGGAADQKLTLADMLTYASEDEYLAYGEYQYIIDTFGSQRPFSNIIKAEEMHISMLLRLFEQHTIPVPEDQSGNYLILPANITKALQAGVQAEIANIAMYDKFLQQDLPDDVRLVFEDLRDASLQHMDAFQKTRG